MNPLILQAAQIGVAAGTGFGSLHSLIMNVTLAQGWRVGMLLVLTPLITDIPIIILMLFILSALPPVAIPLLNIVGGLAVFYIAYSTYRGLQKPPVAGSDAPKTVTRDTLIKGMTVNLINPGPYIYWGTIIGPLFLEAMNDSLAIGASFLLAFYGVFLGIMAVFVLIIDRLRGVDPRLTRGLSYASVAILTFFGVQLILQGLGTLRG